MNATEFEAALHAEGYTEVLTGSQPPHRATQPHAHDFDVRALVTAGEITLTVDGAATRYAVGDIFVMDRGRAHAETIGPDGVTTVVGRRYPD